MSTSTRSLPLARTLVSRHGWAVEYVAIAIARGDRAFFDRDGICREQEIEDVTAMVMATAKEYGDPLPQWWLNFGSISAATLLPIYVDWFHSHGAQLVVYCQVLVVYCPGNPRRLPAHSGRTRLLWRGDCGDGRGYCRGGRHGRSRTRPTRMVQKTKTAAGLVQNVWGDPMQTILACLEPNDHQDSPTHSV